MAAGKAPFQEPTTYLQTRPGRRERASALRREGKQDAKDGGTCEGPQDTFQRREKAQDDKGEGIVGAIAWRAKVPITKQDGKEE